ncbi:MAG TPA: hypothetical protein VFT53_04270 [Candidatus Saccharimonadales bacterium]|nr:hypothetical protein [Candidatus Saccharimonadales bacterium]
MRFTNREEAGMLLAKRLRPFRDTDAVVLALPRGGVVVGGAVARALHLPLNVVLVCKLGHPTDPECSAGAVGERGLVVYDAAAVNPCRQIGAIRKSAVPGTFCAIGGLPMMQIACRKTYGGERFC